MKREWTKSQKQAIDAKGGSIIVSAAAGSGKTAVLVERVISRIIDKENPVDADRILVVTYTRAAANELKERLTNKINELVKLDPYNKALLRQQSLVNKASINTIHGYCSSLVKEFFYELDIDRNFRIAGDGELEIIKRDALKLTLDSMYADGEPDFFRLVEAFGSEKDDSMLQEAVLRVFEFLSSHPYPQWWIDEKLSMFTDFEKVEDTVWYKLLLDYANDAYSYLHTLLESNFELLDLEPVINEKLTPLINQDSEFLQRFKSCLDNPESNSVSDALNSFVAGSIRGLNDYKEHPIKLSIQRNRDLFKDTIKSLQNIFRFSQSECKVQIAELYVISSQLLNCVMQFSENFKRLKASKKIADFSDLEHWTIKLLVDEKTREFTPLAYKIRTRFDEIMVDEYQDANETQDLIFSALSNNGENLFFVGDVKQSIYGFRQAMPQLFLNRKESSFEYDEQAPKFPAKIFLDKNFRSINGVTDIVNFFFKKLMSESVGDIEYNDTESLKCGAKFEKENEPSVEYNLLDLSQFEKPDVATLEATHIAQTIHKMVSERYQVKDGDTYRDACYGDFAVLMRFKREAPIYTEVLNSLMVPAYCEVSSSFINSSEIVFMSNFLSVIDNPALDCELLSVMMSPVFSFSADDLASIKSDSRYDSLYKSVLLKAQNGDEKCERFLKELSFYRDICVTTDVSVLLDIIFERTGYLSIVSALTNSDIALNNLLLLKQYAKEFESGNSKGLSRFVTYLNRLRLSKKDVKASIDVSSLSRNAVQVMSVHSSKGLEFPVCFVCNNAREFSSNSKRQNVYLHSKYGMAVKRKDEQTNVSDTTMPRIAISLIQNRDEMSEELRILYVAMTRAKQKLILVSSHKKLLSDLKSAASKITDKAEILPYCVKNSSHLYDWLLMCALIHPNGEKLRELSACDITFDKDVKAPMKIDVISIPESQENEQVQEVIESIQEFTQTDNAVIDALVERTQFEYKKQALSKLPSKVSASELSHKLSDKKFERALDTPAFMSDSSLTAAQKGTALHAFMQFCDFSLALNDIESEIVRLLEKGYISKVQADSIDRVKALNFIKSDIVSRCINSNEVYKEYRFTIKVDASLVDPDLPDDQKGEKIILQGAVDLAFVEDNELVIVDYKTDRVKDASLLYDMYHNQLEIYKDAMEQCTDYKVKECVIYSVYLGDYIYI